MNRRRNLIGSDSGSDSDSESAAPAQRQEEADAELARQLQRDLDQQASDHDLAERLQTELGAEEAPECLTPAVAVTADKRRAHAGKRRDRPPVLVADEPAAKKTRPAPSGTGAAAELKRLVRGQRPKGAEPVAKAQARVGHCPIVTPAR
jgi:hypothetical protein